MWPSAISTNRTATRVSGSVLNTVYSRANMIASGKMVLPTRCYLETRLVMVESAVPHHRPVPRLRVPELPPALFLDPLSDRRLAGPDHAGPDGRLFYSQIRLAQLECRAVSPVSGTVGQNLQLSSISLIFPTRATLAAPVTPPYIPSEAEWGTSAGATFGRFSLGSGQDA